MGKAIWLWICSLALMCASVQPQTQINLTLLENVVPKGADGSAPSYFYAEGSGSGSNSWIVFLEGGGWCFSISDCRNRSLTHTGSSLYFNKEFSFEGILDLDPSFNPNFYNWHKVFIHYCDGASFMTDIEHPVSNLTFRGARIFKVMTDDGGNALQRNEECPECMI